MLDYRRRLPHYIPDDAAIFVTWRLAGSAPPVCPEFLTAENTGRLPWSQQDNRLDCSRAGPLWLQDTRIARLVEDALLFGESVRRFYSLFAWVIMPNHVHVVFEPTVADHYALAQGEDRPRRKPYPRPHRNALLAGRIV